MSTRSTQFMSDYACKAFDALLSCEAGRTPGDRGCYGSACGKPDFTAGLYRCLSCFHAPSYCKSCLIDTHRGNFGHTVEKWDEDRRCWMRYEWGKLSITLHLGHGGKRCPLSRNEKRKMTIVHDGGVHELEVSFCACPLHPPDFVQLVQARLWPATWTVPRTALTFDVLAHFQQLSTKCNTTAHDFYKYLAGLTDQELLDDVTVRMLVYTYAQNEF